MKSSGSQRPRSAVHLVDHRVAVQDVRGGYTLLNEVQLVVPRKVVRFQTHHVLIVRADAPPRKGSQKFIAFVLLIS